MARVSTPETVVYGQGSRRVVLVDCGVKTNIIRCLLQRDATVVRVPWDYDFTGEEYDGVLLSNGPGDPALCGPAVVNIRKALALGRPVMGICLGNQLLARAAGADTYKLKFGHRGHNQPVLLNGTNRCFITSQNHGYAVDDHTLPDDWKPLFTNVNDGTNEGIRHREKPFSRCSSIPKPPAVPSIQNFSLTTLWVPWFQIDNHLQTKDMMTDPKIKKVLLLGSGALKIGEAGEFDYSGSQALKALKEEGIYTVLINPNIATIQTSEEIADKIYFLPVTPFFVEEVIKKEQPEGIMLAFGGRRPSTVGYPCIRRVYWRSMDSGYWVRLWRPSWKPRIASFCAHAGRNRGEDAPQHGGG